jgi:hypothetical protein
MSEQTREESARFLRNVLLSEYTTIMVNKKLIREVGLLPAALLACLMDAEEAFERKQKSISLDEEIKFFPASTSYISNRYLISPEDQKAIIKVLVKFGLIKTTLIGTPLKRFICIDWSNLEKLLIAP